MLAESGTLEISLNRTIGGTKMFFPRKSAVVVLSALVAAGCAQDGSDNSGQVMGTLGGAALGGLIGSAIGGGSGQAVAIGLGVAAGGLIGNRIGAALDEQSRQRQTAAVQQAVNAPQAGAQSWSLPEQQTQGTVTPLRSFDQNGKQCTEVMQSVTAKGTTTTDTSSYCKEPDGSVTLLN